MDGFACNEKKQYSHSFKPGNVRALDSGEASTLNEVIKVSSEYLSFSKTPKLEERIVNLINEMKNSKKIYEEEGCLYLED